MSDYKLVFNENDENCYRTGTPDSLLVDMFHYKVGRNSNFFQLRDKNSKVIASSRSNVWQFLLSHAKHHIIEVRDSTTKYVIVQGPVQWVINGLKDEYEDFAQSKIELVLYPTWDKDTEVQKTVLCDNTVDTFKVLNNWFEEEQEVQESNVNWKSMYINTELQRIENLIELQDTQMAMEVIRKLVENVQK